MYVGIYVSVVNLLPYRETCVIVQNQSNIFHLDMDLRTYCTLYVHQIDTAKVKKNGMRASKQPPSHFCTNGSQSSNF